MQNGNFCCFLRVAAHLPGVSGTPEDEQSLLVPAEAPSQAETVRGAYFVMHQISTFRCRCDGRKTKARQGFSNRQYILINQADVTGKGVHQPGHIAGS